MAEHRAQAGTQPLRLVGETVMIARSCIALNQRGDRSGSFTARLVPEAERRAGPRALSPYEPVELPRSATRGRLPPTQSRVADRMPGFARLLPSAATDRFVPLGEAHPAHIAQAPGDVATHEIGRSAEARRPLAAYGSQLAVQAIRLVAVAVLARLLTPDDYGAAALAITIGSFSMLLGPFGYGTALVQASTASQRRASTACWCAIGAGAIGSAWAPRFSRTRLLLRWMRLLSRVS